MSAWAEDHGALARSIARGEPTLEDLHPEAARRLGVIGRGLLREDAVSTRRSASTASRSGRRSSHRRIGVDRRAKAAWKAAELRGPTLHVSRHGTVSRLIAAGLDPKAVQTYAGHSAIGTTFDVYGHLFPNTIDRDRDCLDEHLRTASDG